MCEYDGALHKVGEYFETKDCNGYCRCTGPRSLLCVSLCPPVNIYCIPGTRKVRTVEPAFRGSNCTCPSWKCVKGELCCCIFLSVHPGRDQSRSRAFGAHAFVSHAQQRPWVRGWVEIRDYTCFSKQ